MPAEMSAPKREGEPQAAELETGEVAWTHVRCQLCGADKPRELMVDRVRRQGRTYHFHVARCRECGFVYVTPRGEGAIFGNVAGGAARADAATANRRVYEKGLRELRAGGLPAGGRILDVGCARGDFLAFAADAGYDVVGVDINPKLAEVARVRGFDVHTGDLRELDLKDERCDAITMWDVIEHVDDPIELLAACGKVLAPGGLILFHTGNARFQIPKARVLQALRPKGGPYLIPYQHLSHFDPATARRALTSAGYEPVCVFFAGTLQYRQPWKRLAMRALNLLGTLPVYVGGPLLTNAMGAIGRWRRS